MRSPVRILFRTLYVARFRSFALRTLYSPGGSRHLCDADGLDDWPVSPVSLTHRPARRL